MTDYKRMVSYMYQYEDGMKKKNVGFVRVESRGGQSKITLHMQLLGQLDSIFPTYLIKRRQQGVDLIYLGDALLRNQVMDSKLSTDENNVMGSGTTITGMSGILLFLNDKVFYATIWDDMPIVAQEVLEALKPGRNRHDDKRKEAPEKDIEPDKELVNTKEQKVTSSVVAQKDDPPKQADTKEENSSDYYTPRYMLPGGYKMVERQKWQQMETVEKDEEDIDNEPSVSPEIWNDIPGNRFAKVSNVDAMDVEQPQVEVPEMVSEEDNGYPDPSGDHIEDFTDNDTPSREFNIENQEQLFKLIEEMNKVQLSAEQQSDSLQPTHEFFPEPMSARHFFDNYPRIYPFEDNEIIQCVKIEPKDIGLLPKNIWPFSNNSFLMHGYYCYHHLIFAKLKSGSGYLYILGIPGLFHQREQFMARMFGFENFKSVKKREIMQGDFGYWYLPVTL